VSSDTTRIRVSSSAGAFAGQFWFAGWLFTIGFAKLHFGKALLAIVIWAYYLGAALK
jgi:hypothetical protein